MSDFSSEQHTLLKPFMQGNDAFGGLPPGFDKILICKVATLVQEEIV